MYQRSNVNIPGIKYEYIRDLSALTYLEQQHADHI